VRVGVDRSASAVGPIGSRLTGAMFILLLAACEGPGSTTDPTPYPLDDLLTFADLQAKGTHNSYHIATSTLEAWDYTHAPLGEQLGDQGVRQFELDVSFDEQLGQHRVFHVLTIDEGTTCDTFVQCAQDLETWSAAHPGHHPLFILVETKDPWFDATGRENLDALDAELLQAWPRDRLITPGEVDLSEGWPTLGELRGRALFVLHDGGERRAAYVETLADRPMFPDAQGDPDLPYAAVHTMNDPYDPRIAEVVAGGHLVRTRADVDTEQARTGDPSMRDQALASGAHFVSTDYPAPVEGLDYVVEIPGGSPSRCNPLRAPPECTAEAIESPERL
jgi:Phosphoinositide phospholipase C, Ca2+-dependent